MAHPLLQVRDSLSLSYTKFKTRRIRTALTLISTAVLALLLVVASSVMTGFIKAGSETPQAELVDLHLAQEWSNSGPSTPERKPSLEHVNKAVDEQRKKVPAQYPLRNVYVDVASNVPSTATLDLLPKKATPKSIDDVMSGSEWSSFGFFGNGFTTRSTALLQPYVDPSQNLNWKQGEPLPVLIPTPLLTNAYEDELKKIKDAKTRVEKRQSLQRNLIGKTGKLTVTQEDFSMPSPVPTTVPSETEGAEELATPAPEAPKPPPTVIDVRVVGFITGSAIFGNSEGFNDFQVPYELARQASTIDPMLDQVRYVYPSFENTADRNAYVKNSSAMIYADPAEENKQWFDELKKGFNIAVIVMLVLLAIPMAATVSKLLSDSQRETGVFRAIGARNHHILGIYGWYVVQMCIGSFLIALAIGMALCAYITSKWAGGIELAAADYADTPINLSFVQFNLRQLGVIFLGMVAGGFVGSAIPLWRAMRRDPIKALTRRVTFLGMLSFRLKHRVRSSLWFIPVSCVLGGVLLSTLTLAIDRHNKFELIPQSYTGGPDAALQILSAIAASMVNLAALVLTITMVVVQLATGQYSPRIVRPFVQDRPSQYAIGIFVVTFAHALLTMREITDTQDTSHVPGLSVVVAFILVVASIMVLVLYVNHIGQALTVAGIIDSVSSSTTDLVHKNYDLKKAEHKPDTVLAGVGGVVFRIDEEKLVKHASKCDCTIEVLASIGEFVPQGAPLCRIDSKTGSTPDHDIIRKAVSLGPERTLNNDVAYGVRMLVDIALRSASDALRDPTTTVQAIDRLHDALRQLATAEFPSGEHRDESGTVRVRVPVMTWDGFVLLAFEEIRQAGLWSPQITRRLRSAFDDLHNVALPERKPAIELQMHLLEQELNEKDQAEDQRKRSLTPDPQGFGSGVDVRQ